MVIEKNVLLKIRVEIDVIIDLFKVSGVIFFILLILIVFLFMDENERDGKKRESDMKRNYLIYLVFVSEFEC